LADYGVGGASFLEFDHEQPALVLADGQNIQGTGVGLELLPDKSVTTFIDVVFLS
jgi:hypothetical protein